MASNFSSSCDPLTEQAEAFDTDDLELTPTGPKITGKLYAVSDIHLSFPGNRKEWASLKPHPGDGLILCGDIGESLDHLHSAFSLATKSFDRVWWVPGNHELYTLPTEAQHEGAARGETKYLQCVEVAKSYGVLTPEDDFVLWNGEGGPVVVAPIFTLYDYSFRPPEVSLEGAVDWAREEDVEATDEHLLHPDPYPTRQDWCKALVAKFETKLEETRAQHPTLPFVIANHWPLRPDLVYLMSIPRFSIWCGTTLTEDWPTRFNAKVVISGHIHIRRTDWKDGTRFEEVSLGYPRQWKDCVDEGNSLNEILREILPGPEMPVGGNADTQWRRYG
jgi:predicted phosphodiesterase